MTNVTLNTAIRKCTADKYFLGYEGENNINKLIFKFEDGFRDGLGILNIEREGETGYLSLDKIDNTYELEVKSALLSKIGEITFQLSINEPDGTVIKYDTFTMIVKDAIDTDSEMPEEYPSWVDMANAKLTEVDEAINRAESVSSQLLEDKANGVFNGKDGVDGKDGENGKDGANGKDGTNGKDGFSPVATVTQTDTGATISITDTNGTTTAIVRNGKDGESGILEETDPVYLADKPNIALKSELPTKLSQLQNDSEFITKTVNNLTNYYAKTETYTKTEINNLIGGLGSLDLEIVQSLPTVGKENTFYLLAQNREAPDIYDEYLYINGWEKIGNTKVDLTNYYTKSEVDNLIPVVPTKVSELENDSEYLTEYTETDPTIPTYVKNITQENINNWNNKSEFSGSYNDLTDKPSIPSIEGLATTEQLTQGLATKQDTLTAGDNITIENGVISATGGGGTTELPIASSTTLGGIKVGDGLEITEDGILSAITGGVSGGGSSYKETELLSKPVDYAQGVTIGQDLSLLDNIENYDALIFGYTAHNTSSDNLYTNSEKLILCSNIVYNNSNTASNNKESYILTIDTQTVRYLALYFKNSNTIRIGSTRPALASTDYFQIYSIKGIKY